MPSTPHVVLGLSVVLLSACRSAEQRQDAERPDGASWFTGNVSTDFVDPTTVTILDPGGLDVGVPLVGSGAISGNDIEYIALDYDPAADILSVGVATYGVAGDVDGDGDGGLTSGWLGGLGGTDVPDFGGTEAFAIGFDIDEDGTLDAIAGVSGLGADTGGFSVSRFSGSPYTPGFAFGAPLPAHTGGLFASPSASAPHVEFTVSSFSTLADSLGLADASEGFAVYAFMGSFSDAGIGEDFLPGVGMFEPVCFDDDGDGFTTCDLDCDDANPAAYPGAEEVCDGLDNDCDGTIDVDESGDDVCAACTTYDLGDAGDANIFVFGDYTDGLDVAGRVVACGDVALSDFAVGFALTGGDALVAGGDLTLAHGTVHGDAWYGGSASVSESVDFANGGSLLAGVPVDCAAEEAALTDLSADLAAEPATGLVSVSAWGQIELIGLSAGVNVFSISGADLAAATQLDISAPAGSVAVINIDGAAASMSNFGIFLDGIDETGILYNFTEATALTMSAIGVRGTVLAPLADVDFSNGNFDGALIAASLTGTAEGHDFPFGGPFEVCDEE